MTIVKTMSLAAGVAAASLWFVAPSSAASVIRQNACSTGSTCFTFGPSTAIPIVRSFSFNAPAAGTALAVFNGTLYCASTTIADTVVDFVAQIVENAGAAVDANGPGGMRVATVFKDEADHAFDASTTFNLSSSRAFPVSAGVNKVHFKLARLRMDAGTSCTVYSATFSVVTAP